MLLLNVIIFIFVFVITQFIHVGLYKKGVGITFIRTVLISCLLAYIGLMHKPNDIWSSTEITVVVAIFAAQLFTVNRYDKTMVNNVETPNPVSTQEPQYEQRPKHSFVDWLSHTLMISWLLSLVYDEVDDGPSFDSQPPEPPHHDFDGNFEEVDHNFEDHFDDYDNFEDHVNDGNNGND